MTPQSKMERELFIYTVFNSYKHVLLLSSSIIFLFFPLIIQNLQKYILMMQGKMTTLHGFSKNQDMSTNVVMPYQNDSQLYFLIFENSMMA